MPRILLLLAALLIVLSCSRESKEPLWEPESLKGGKEYRGGLFPVWITLKEPVESVGSISWRTGRAEIAERKQATNAKKQITADTVFLYWETQPLPFVEIDTVKNDTAYYYRDTVYAIVEGLESLPIVIEVKKILPRITKIVVGGLEQPGSSVLTIAAHPGDPMEISIHLEKPIQNDFNTIITMPAEMGSVDLISKQDELFVYKWIAPNVPITDTLRLKIEDSGGGYGDARLDGRFYKVHLVVYARENSVWVASEEEIVKYSPTGVEVARISEGFESISDMAVNSNNGRLYVVDEAGNSLLTYDTYGKLLSKESSFNKPTGVAVDVERSLVWVADREKLKGGDKEFAMVGPIKGVSINQFREDFVWFAIPESDMVGFVRSASDDPTYIDIAGNWNRPSMVSHDPKSGIAWVADSSRIVAINENSDVLAIVSGFNFVNSVSASGGSVWAADPERGKVYRFKGPFRGNADDLKMTIIDGMAVEGFLSPISVSAYIKDGGAWVVDRGAGKVVRLDSLGEIKAFGTGLSNPYLGKTLQIVE